ncbi:hypothetical protein [Actinospongicola halichondriae]|uniref:hypothetical protein n=1 Tax=Actinospongicola halichondriae TaxID=3236844 RepID=UPI003D3A60E5
MTILRTVCPTCGVVRVRAPETTLRTYDSGLSLEVDFSCPGCESRVVQQLNARMLPLLVSAGCVVEDDFPSDAEGAISESEIRAFTQALDRDDWADELAY